MSAKSIESGEGGRSITPVLSPGAVLDWKRHDREDSPSPFSTGLALRLAREIVTPHVTDPDILISYYAVESRQVEKRLKRMIQRNRFNGRFGSERALIIPPDPTAFSGATSALPLEDMRAFVGAIDLFSTGRGNIGSFSYRVDIALRALNQHDGGSGIIQPDFAVRMDPVNGRSIQRLLDQSQATWAHTLREGLRTVFPGGLPGLGKRA